MNLECNHKALLQAPGQAGALNEKKRRRKDREENEKSAGTEKTSLIGRSGRAMTK
jgi:hypothetical protein